MASDWDLDLDAQGRTLLALTRLLKVQIRLFVFTKKLEEEPDKNWGLLIKVEREFLVGANREWVEILDLWKDSAQRTKLIYHLMDFAIDSAMRGVLGGLRPSVPDVDLVVSSFRAGVRVE